MHAIALALAVSLGLGPAATEVSPTPEVAPEPASEAEAPAQAVSPESAEPAEPVAPSGAEAPEPEAAPEPEVAPAPEPPASDPEALVASTTEAQQPVEPAPPVVHDRLGCDDSKRCRRMTIAGIVVGTLGFGGVGAGIGLLINRDQVVPETPVFVISTRPAGLVMLTVSSGVAFTAVLMLVAAHKGYKQRPDDQARIRLTPTGLRF